MQLYFHPDEYSVISPVSVATAGEIGISSLGSPLNNGMLASTRGKSLKTYLLPSLDAVHQKGSSLDLDEASFSSESSPALRSMYLPISWTDADGLRNPPSGA